VLKIVGGTVIDNSAQSSCYERLDTTIEKDVSQIVGISTFCTSGGMLACKKMNILHSTLPYVLMVWVTGGLHFRLK